MFFLFIILFNLTDLLAQTDQQDKTKSRRPKYDLHLGVGNINGLQIGGRIMIDNIISFEASVGSSANIGYLNVFGHYSESPILSLGINGHFWKNKNLVISIISDFLEEYNNKFRLTYITPAFGAIILNDPGLHFFIRLGPYFEVNSFKFGGDIGVHVDLGFNFVIN